MSWSCRISTHEELVAKASLHSDFKEKSLGFYTGLVIVLTNPFELTCEPESLLHSVSALPRFANHGAEEKGESGSASC